MKILLNEAQRELYNELVGVYGAMVSQNNTSKLVGKSIATLYRERVEGVGIAYKQGKITPKKASDRVTVFDVVEVEKALLGAWYEIIIN